MATDFNPWKNQSYLSQQVRMDNFVPQLSASLAAGATSASVTFTPLTGVIRITYMIANKGTTGAYIAWGKGSATAVASSGTPAANCQYIGAGNVLTLDFQASTGPVDTIAAIRETSDTTLEISLGYGQ